MSFESSYGSRKYGAHYVSRKDEWYAQPPVSNSFVTESGENGKHPGRLYWFTLERVETGFMNRKFVAWAESEETWKRRMENEEDATVEEGEVRI